MTNIRMIIPPSSSERDHGVWRAQSSVDCLLIFAGLTGLTGIVDRMRFYGRAAWAAGFLSGTLGGLVGTHKEVFARPRSLDSRFQNRPSSQRESPSVSWSMDCALQLYFVSQWRELMEIWPLILLGTIAVVIGTAGGEQVLKQIPESLFCMAVSVLLVVLGCHMSLAT